MKRILALILTLMLMALGAGTAWADTSPSDSGTARTLANTEIQSLYGYTGGYFKSQDINGDVFDHSQQWETGIPLHGVTSHMLIYGDPSAPDSTGFSRYLGFTTAGESFTNIQHPYDVLDVSSLDQLNWIPQPWNWNTAQLIAAKAAGAYGNLQPSPFDGLAGFGSGVYYHSTHSEIMAGLFDSDPTYMSDSAANDTPWEQMVHIWDVPTRWAWGAGIMYDTGSKIPASDLANAPTVYYKTVLLPPLDPSYWPTGTLAVTPATATIDVGATQQYDAVYTPPSGGQPVDVTSSSSWSSDNTFVATIVSTTGLATGSAAGATDIIASYVPPGGSSLTGQAVLNVQAQQQPSPTSGGGIGLTFQAVNQANVETLMGKQIGGTLQRGPNIALWTDTVTATLNTQQPDVSAYVPSGGTVTGVTWSVSNASLTYPAINPNFSYGNPVEPTTTTSASMTSSGHQATVSFVENWSEDGIGYGSSVGTVGVMDNLEGSPYCGQIMAKNPQSYNLSAAYTLSGTVTGYTIEYVSNGQGGITAVQVPFSVPFTMQKTASGTLWVCGAGATPITGTGERKVMIGSTANPQTHP